MSSKAYTKAQKEEEAKKKAVQEQTLALQHEIFFQLMKVQQFTHWFEKNIRVSHDIDEKDKTIQVKVHYIGDEGDPSQNLVRCPGCRLKFDANVEAKLISLATQLPTTAKPPED